MNARRVRLSHHVAGLQNALLNPLRGVDADALGDSDAVGDDDVVAYDAAGLDLFLPLEGRVLTYDRVTDRGVVADGGAGEDDGVLDPAAARASIPRAREFPTLHCMEHYICGAGKSHKNPCDW